MQKTLTIVGGGSSGWMTAIYLNRLFNQSEQRLQIRLVESPDIGIIGVGEATVHSIRFFFAAMGLDEQELLRETNASFKTGILFRNWMAPVNGVMHEYFHPFEQQQLGRQLDISSCWFVQKREAQERYDQGVSLSAALMAAGHGPKSPQSRPYQGVVPYGYHLDASLLARFLRRKAVEAGVEHIQDTVTDVTVQDGNILAVHSAQASYHSDWFIDSTGFRGLLMEALGQDNWQSFEDALPCNRAVAIQRELPKDQQPHPYTVATALSHGWAWQIDLTSRQGTGYVYDGNALTPEQAEQELREFLGWDSGFIKCTHLKMKVGCRREFWKGNCIAVGLAGGFIEPLESTGLHLINLGARLLGTHLMQDKPGQVVRDAYNKAMNGFYQDLKRFIVLHYCLTNRTDTGFWRKAAASADYCEGLPEMLALWKQKICEYHDLAGGYATTFVDENYRYILYGMQHYPELNFAGCDELNQPFEELRRMSEKALQMTMPHGDYLRQYCQQL
ncbi:tryptophan halogenase family protein [Rheinheimera sp.]|uniref:tryptophan halogenase family protein n=1 Tax=Rheinheimera sp. TaxID=1869214 RepID=UPI00307D2276